MSKPAAPAPRGIVERVWLFFATVKLTVVLLALLAGAMAYGTYVETMASNGAARILVYRAWWFDTLIALLALNLIGCTLKRAPYKIHQTGWITTHIALLILMAGAVITHRFGMQGSMMITEGEANRVFFSETLDRQQRELVDGPPVELPFAVKLVSFDQALYPGTGMTRLFRSRVEVIDAARPETLKHDIVLNHPLVYGKYKLSQSSWMDLPDGKQATILGVAYDPGILLMYLGGGLLVLGMAGIFFLKPYLKRRFPPQPVKRERPLAGESPSMRDNG